MSKRNLRNKASVIFDKNLSQKIIIKENAAFLQDYIPYPRQCNPGVLLIFWVFRPRTVVYFGEKSAKITVFLADFSPKMTKVRPKYVAWGCIQDGVVFTRIRYILFWYNKKRYSNNAKL